MLTASHMFAKRLQRDSMLDGLVADTTLACRALQRDSMPMECRQTWLLHVDLDLRHNDWCMFGTTRHRDGPEASGIDCRLCQECRRSLTKGGGLILACQGMDSCLHTKSPIDFSKRCCCKSSDSCNETKSAHALWGC